MIDKNLISIYDLTKEDILSLISRAEHIEQQSRYGQSLQDRKLALAFYENSTRTKKSFSTAMIELGGHVYDLNIQTSSVKKRESLRDTLMMLQSHNADCIAIRHPKDGSAQWAADISSVPIINGGDGKNQHPTQTLLDLLTIKKIFGRLDNISIGFGGDLKYGRTVHSLPIGLSHFENVHLHLAAPPEFAMPESLIAELKDRGMKITIHSSLQDCLAEVEVFYQTRPQLERMADDPRRVQDILKEWRITTKLLSRFPQVKILHPLPIDSAVSEIDSDVAYTSQQQYYTQASNGIFMRKAILTTLFEHYFPTQFTGSLHSLGKYLDSNLLKKTIQDHDVHTDRYIDNIPYGYVIDHLQPGTALTLAKDLELDTKACSVFLGTNVTSRSGDQKEFIKVQGGSLSQRDKKSIALRSPGATVNIISEGKVTSKFHILLCQNDNCISRELLEDVPPRFTYDGKLHCRYCRSVYAFPLSRVSSLEWTQFYSTLN